MVPSQKVQAASDLSRNHAIAPGVKIASLILQLGYMRLRSDRDLLAVRSARNRMLRTSAMESDGLFRVRSERKHTMCDCSTNTTVALRLFTPDPVFGVAVLSPERRGSEPESAPPNRG